ncbi:hypothetical protein A45J_2683 [hot springs metagenome]
MVTDVDCPFCKKAWEWLKTQNNYTLYVFLSPIEQLHPNAKDKSIKILCSNDVAKALDNVKSGKTLNAKNCEAGTAKLAEHVLVSEVIGVTGTPVFVLGDGRKIEGFNKPVIENYFSGGNNEK